LIRFQLIPLFDSLFDSYSTLDNVTTKILSVSGCSVPHGEFLVASGVVCGVGLLGVTFLLLSSLAAAFIFTILVGFDSHAWIYIQKRFAHQDHSYFEWQVTLLSPISLVQNASKQISCILRMK
jgi:hypothetical protein